MDGIFGQALRNLWAHKMRSGLTVLGVIIGIAALLIIVTLGASLEESVVGQFDSVDDRAIFVNASSSGQFSGPPDAGQFGNIFTGVDRDFILGIDGVESVSAEGSVAISSVEWSGKTVAFQSLRAAFPDDGTLRKASNFQSGSAFKTGANEAVLGSSIFELLNSTKAIGVGDKLTVTDTAGKSFDLTITGILNKPEGLFGDGATDIFVPVDPFYQTVLKSPTSGQLSRVFPGFSVYVDSPKIINDVKELLDEYFQSEKSDAFQLIDPSQTRIDVATASDIQKGIGAFFDQITLFIAAIAIVSLVVGAIGIANIMLVSVTERTKEIGTMKAIGARNGTILGIFLMEAALVGLLGSIIGIVFGLSLGILASSFVFEGTPPIPYDWVAIGLVVGIGVGIVAGILPARRATKLQIVQALGHE